MKYQLFTLFIILSSCANQTAPTGGPKDKTPPTLVYSNPEHQSVNVSTNEIELEFDEYIKLDKAKEQIIISPNIDSDIQYQSRKNRVFIKFDKYLPDSTTFTINFREGIKDITEGNSPKDLKLAFSTGSYLDSLTISGSVKDLLTDKPSKDYSIFLYNSKDTLNIFEDSPLYFTKTNKTGRYKFENIKNGEYKIYAVNDDNKNLKLDFSTESYAFLDSTLVLNDTLADINLRTYYFNIDSNKLKSARQNGTIYELKFSKYVSTYVLKSYDSTELYSNFTDKEHRSIQIFNYNITSDSLQTIIEYSDSTKLILTDTVTIKFEETVRTPKEFTQNIKLEKIFPSDGNLKGVLEFNKPIISINYDSIYLYLDSLNLIPLTPSNLQVNQLKDSYNLSYTIDKSLFESKEPKENSQNEIKPKELSSNSSTNDSTETKTKSKPPSPTQIIRPHLYIGKGAFVSAENDSIISKKTNLTFTKLDEYGTILLETRTTYTNYVVQLLNSEFKIIQELPGQSKMTFYKVPAGEYTIRVLIDNNQNGIWDLGNINNNEPPEQIYFYTNDEDKKEITIRANWELGPLILDF